MLVKGRGVAKGDFGILQSVLKGIHPVDKSDGNDTFVFYFPFFFSPEEFFFFQTLNNSSPYGNDSLWWKFLMSIF